MVEKRIRDGDDVSQTAMDKSQAVIGDEFRQSPKTGSLTSKNDDKRHCVSGCSTASSDDMLKKYHMQHRRLTIATLVKPTVRSKQLVIGNSKI